MTKIKVKYSLFCKKRPQKGLIYTCVYFPSISVWKVCQGKPYADGRLRYIDNGVEGISKRFHHQTIEGYSVAKLRKLVIELNMKVLQTLYFLPVKPRRFHARFLDAEIDLPVVEMEDDNELTINNSR